MLKRTKIFYDSEFTGLHQDTTLISLGIISECGKQFYAEFIDYDDLQVDDWLEEHVIANTLWLKDFDRSSLDIKTIKNAIYRNGWNLNTGIYEVCGDTNTVKDGLITWLTQFEKVVLYSDVLAYDWVLFNNIFGHAFKIPENVFYIPLDIATLFELIEGDADMCRLDYVDMSDIKGQQHNALFDAIMIKRCYEKLIAKYNQLITPDKIIEVTNMGPSDLSSLLAK